MEISVEERNRVLEKARRIIETGKGELLTNEEEAILGEITGVVYVAYKSAVNYLSEKEQGGIEYER